jgi:F420-dependent oxidoreductase-like protein
MLNQQANFECWTTLGALSAITKKIRLGTMVTCNSFRNPSLLAKMAATIDNISNGKLELGIGAGIQKYEHVAYGFDFPSLKVRVERLYEAVEIIKKMWTKNLMSFDGKHYRIKDVVCEPKPVQKPHPPIIIGGSGEKLTLKVTAQYADRFDWGFLSSFETYKQKLRILEKHCKVIGRNFNEIERSCWPVGQIFIGSDKEELEKRAIKLLPKGIKLKKFMQTNFFGTPEDYIMLLKKYITLGVTHFMLFFGEFSNLNDLKLFSKKVASKIN